MECCVASVLSSHSFVKPPPIEHIPMSTYRNVEMLRIPNIATEARVAEEHRPAASVFPTQANKMKKVDEATVQAALGAYSYY